jgi:hypothetical protein
MHERKQSSKAASAFVHKNMSTSKNVTVWLHMLAKIVSRV